MEKNKVIDIFGARNYDLVIVTTRVDEKINGQAVGWISQASIDPPMIGMGLSVKTLTTKMIKDSGSFAVNFIPKNRQDLIELFGYKSGRDMDKLANLSSHSAKTGSPILNDAIAYLDCSLTSVVDLDSYNFFFGEVLDADYSNLNWFSSKDFKQKAA